ncbi:hypothetical protein N9849_00505 [bacterium]|nr:hypothetical protein [bacterium]
MNLNHRSGFILKAHQTSGAGDAESGNGDEGNNGKGSKIDFHRLRFESLGD